MKSANETLAPAPGKTTVTPAAAATPAGEAVGKAKPNPQPVSQPQMSAVDLIAQIEADPAGFVTEGDDADEGGESKIEDAKTKGAPKTETAEEKVAREAKEAAEAKRKEGEVREDARPTTELTADQKAWVELRAAAKTPAEAAEVDKQAPEFTDEQWAEVEKQFTAAAGKGASEVPTEIQTQLETAQGELATAKAALEAKSKRLTEVETELATAKATPVAVAAMHPLMTATLEDIAKAETNAVALKEWALKHWDGTQAQGDQPAYTAEQVRGAYARADKQLSAIIPAARETHQIFEQQNVTARAVYPALFDANSPHSRTRESILRQLPGLKAGLPQISIVMGDAIVGETLRGVLLAETPTADAVALRAALLKAVPGLKDLMPALTATGAAKPPGKLPAKPIVPLARPSGAAGARPLAKPGASGSGKTQNKAPDAKKFVQLRADNGGNELAALTETLHGVNVE